MLRTHLIICSCLVVLILPIWWLDNQSLKGSGRDWISLDFRGLFVRFYIAFLIAHILVSTIAVYLFRGTNMWVIQLCSGLCAIALLGAAMFVYDKVQRSQARSASEQRLELRKAHLHDIELKRWWYVPDETDPREIHLELVVAVTGRFSGNTKGFNGAPQRTVSAGELFTYVFTRDEVDPASIVGEQEFTFYLFRGPVGTSTPEDVSIVFGQTPGIDDDGSYFHATLPPNSQVHD